MLLLGRSAEGSRAITYSLRVPRSAATRGRASSEHVSGPRPRCTARQPLYSCVVLTTSSFCLNQLPGDTLTARGTCLGDEWGSAQGSGRPCAERGHGPEERLAVHGRA